MLTLTTTPLCHPLQHYMVFKSLNYPLVCINNLLLDSSLGAWCTLSHDIVASFFFNKELLFLKRDRSPWNHELCRFYKKNDLINNMIYSAAADRWPVVQKTFNNCVMFSQIIKSIVSGKCWAVALLHWCVTSQFVWFIFGITFSHPS